VNSEVRDWSLVRIGCELEWTSFRVHHHLGMTYVPHCQTLFTAGYERPLPPAETQTSGACLALRCHKKQTCVSHTAGCSAVDTSHCTMQRPAAPVEPTMARCCLRGPHFARVASRRSISVNAGRLPGRGPSGRIPAPATPALAVPQQQRCHGFIRCGAGITTTLLGPVAVANVQGC
jgi:hypothetical protein